MGTNQRVGDEYGPTHREATTFGAALREARGRLQVSQAYLSERVGIAQTRLSLYERGTGVPPPKLVFALERELAVPPGALSQHLGYVPY